MDHHLDWEEHWGRFFKPVQIIGWWNDTYYLMNGDIFILECITDIQSTGSKYMHIRDINVDSKGFSICQWTVVLIKTNTLNLRTPIFTVACNKFTYIRTFTFLHTCINKLSEDLCSIREEFDRYGRQKKDGIFALFILQK